MWSNSLSHEKMNKYTFSKLIRDVINKKVKSIVNLNRANICQLNAHIQQIYQSIELNLLFLGSFQVIH